MFEDYLKTIHDKQYTGTGGKEALVEDYERWLEKLTDYEMEILSDGYDETLKEHV